MNIPEQMQYAVTCSEEEWDSIMQFRQAFQAKLERANAEGREFRDRLNCNRLSPREQKVLRLIAENAKTEPKKLTGYLHSEFPELGLSRKSICETVHSLKKKGKLLDKQGLIYTDS